MLPSNTRSRIVALGVALSAPRGGVGQAVGLGRRESVADDFT